MSQDELLIWWTDAAECEELGRPMRPCDLDVGETLDDYAEPGFLILDDDCGWPSYLGEQYGFRWGSNGRGRLWTADCMGEVRVSWDETKPITRRLKTRGGVVFYARDIAVVATLPGIVTTLDLDPYHTVARGIACTQCGHGNRVDRINCEGCGASLV